jgi:diguanylate cyclase
MTLDAQTLFFSMWVNVTLMSGALVVGVHWRQKTSRTGIHAWSAALLCQSVGWALLMLAFRGWPRELSTLGAGALVASVGCMYVAVQSYLRRPVRLAWVVAPPLAVAVVHWLVFPYFGVRIAVVNGVLGVQMGWLAWALLRPGAAASSWRWRWLAGVGLAASAPLVLGRMAIALWAPERYPAFDSPHWLNALGLVVNNACLTIGTLAFLLAHRDEAEQALRRLATIDGLTGVLNRRTLLERAEEQVALAQRHRQPLTVLMLDLDHFKEVNDTRGHPAGDRALELFADALRLTLRQPDLVGRYGGEEFCVVLPMSGLDAVHGIDARLRERLQHEVGPLLGFRLGFSAGAAQLQPGDDGLGTVIARADRALYAAKSAGRGRLVLDGAPAAADAGPAEHAVLPPTPTIDP